MKRKAGLIAAWVATRSIVLGLAFVLAKYVFPTIVRFL